MKVNAHLPIFFKILFLIVTISFISFSCKKIEQPTKSDIVKIEVADFFNISDAVPTEIKKIVLDLAKQKGFKQQLNEFVKLNGFPAWEKSLMLTDNATKTASSKTLGSKSTETDIEDGLFFVPLKDPFTGEIKSYISCVKHNDSIYTYRLYNKEQVINIEVDHNDTLKASRNRVLSVFAYFEEKINNSNSTYFGGKTNSKIKNVSINAVTNNSNNAGRVSSTYICGWRDVQLVSVYADASGTTVVEIYTVSYFTFCGNITGGGGSGGTWGWDPSNVGTPDGTPGGGTGGSYGGITYYTGATGSYGGTNYGWWNYGTGYNGVYIPETWNDPSLYPWGSGPYYDPTAFLHSNAVQLLTGSLGLTQDQQTWLLNNSYQFSDALVNYLAFGTHPQDYKERMAREHISLLMSDPVYNSFVTNYHTANGGIKVWWEDEQWLNVNHPGLYSNIINLSLDIKGSYYLVNNSFINRQITDLYNKPYSHLTIADKKLIATEFINKIMADPQLFELAQELNSANVVIHPWMVELFKELALELGWKIIKKYIPGYGDWQSIKDAIEEAKDGDWLGMLGEVLNIVKKKVPALAVIDAIVDLWENIPLVNKAWKAFDKLKELPTNAFQGILKTIKDKCGGLIEKIEHDNNIQGKIKYNPSDAFNFFKEIASNIGVSYTTFTTSSGTGGALDLPGGFTIKFYPVSSTINPSTGAGYPTIEILKNNVTLYKFRFE